MNINSTYRPKRQVRHYPLQIKQAHVSDWQKSGLTMSAYCKANDLAIATFSAWASKPEIKLSNKFVPITQDQNTSAKLVKQNELTLDLQVTLPNGIVIHPSKALNLDGAIKLIEGLRQCS